MRGPRFGNGGYEILVCGDLVSTCIGCRGRVKRARKERED